MIKAILFDLDGTLFDRDTSVRQLVTAQCQAYASALTHVAEATFVARFLELDAHGYVKKDRVYQALVEEFSITSIPATDLFDYFLTEYHKHCVPCSHLFEMLNELQSMGLQLGMITNGATQFQMNTIRALGIEPYFSAILISEAEGIRKPEAAIFQRAIDRLGVRAVECVFVGDHPTVDIAGARNAGLKGVWKRNAVWERPTAADGMVDDLGQLASVIRHLTAASGGADL
jgi:putative hydrolase of the HAD superfamily